MDNYTNMNFNGQMNPNGMNPNGQNPNGMMNPNGQMNPNGMNPNPNGMNPNPNGMMNPNGMNPVPDIQGKLFLTFEEAKKRAKARMGGHLPSFPIFAGKIYDFDFSKITTETIQGSGIEWEAVSSAQGPRVSLTAFIRMGAVKDIEGNEISDFSPTGVVKMKCADKTAENGRNYYTWQVVE